MQCLQPKSAVVVSSIMTWGACVLQGTHVTSGRCKAVVVGTGASTAIGKIRDAMVASQVRCFAPGLAYLLEVYFLYHECLSSVMDYFTVCMPTGGLFKLCATLSFDWPSLLNTQPIYRIYLCEQLQTQLCQHVWIPTGPNYQAHLA